MKLLAHAKITSMSNAWRWLSQTDSGLFLRIGIGALIFLILGLLDLRRNGRQARRWREYLFLLACVLAALCYGAANDLITVRISPEYFLYGKELSPLVEKHPDRLPWEATKVGLKATWTVGLLIGVACLIANNPRRDRLSLTYGQLGRRVAVVFGSALTCALLLGVIGFKGGLVASSVDFQEMVARDQFRPYRFMAVFGIHLGGYVGGLIGAIVAVISIRRARRRAGSFA